ncbi:MAG: glycosyltransferase family 2 protein [Candidatus Aureabacteria bacterium]|nr:glycosyltransferase family 2 protein [Candidatus Auribacterota bacterium]
MAHESQEMRPSVAAIVLNYRRPQDTIECVRSLQGSEEIGLAVIIVDNGSGDDSAERIAAAFPALTLLRAPSNLGYAGGNNIGIREALRGGAEYLFIVNNDCTVAPDAVAKMFDAARSSGAGIVSPAVYEYSRPDILQYAGYRNLHLLAQGIPIGEGEIDRGQYAQGKEMNAAPGCAMMIGRSVFEKVGLFDERFFCYSEELDLCRRATEAGYRILFDPAAHVWHKKAATLDERSPEYLYYLTRGRLIYARKHLGWYGFLFVFLPYFLTVKLLKGIIVSLFSGRPRNAAALLRAVGWNLRNSL